MGLGQRCPPCRSAGSQVTVVNFVPMTFVGTSRVVLVANRKGGVGKSSIVAATAQAVASGGRRGGGHRVLIIDGDPQGTITKSDLGARDTSDRGASLGRTLLYGDPLVPLQGLKPNLDLIAGGNLLSKAIPSAASMPSAELAHNVQSALERLCTERSYDFVFIDSAPGEMPLLDAFLQVANYVLIPTQSDGGSLDAVEELAARFNLARRAGATIQLLGVVLFAADPAATVRNADVIAQVEEILGGSGVTPFKTLIRENKAAACDMRNLGMTAAELIPLAKQARTQRLKALRDGEKPGRPMWASNPLKLAGDYQSLVYEIVSRIAQAESPVATVGDVAVAGAGAGA